MDCQSFQPGGQEQNQAPIPEIPKTQNLSERLRPYQWHIAIVGGIIIALLFGAYSYLKYTNEQLAQKVVPTFTSRVDATTDWKTYTNTQYGFEFKYPLGHELEKFDFINNTEGTEDHSVSFAIEDNKRGVGYDGIIYFAVKVGIGNPENFIKNAYSPLRYDEWTSGGKLQKTTFAGRPAIIDKSNAFNGGYFSAYIYGKDDSYFILISQGSNNELLTQILSTFKFIESTDLSTGKTYRNEQYGFEVKIPQDWTVTPSQDYPNASELFFR